MNTNERSINRLRKLVCVSAVLWFTTVLAAEPALIERGRVRYQDDCSGCHGPRADGDGTVAAILTIAPPDLTIMSKDNGGEFPADRVRRVIDGRDSPAAAHGPVEMPVWGQHYKRSLPGYSEEPVQRKIDELVAYLQSIQVD